jgi:hypothetical protein
MVVSSAIKLDNGSFFVGCRHTDCYQSARKLLHLHDNKSLLHATEGFITDKLTFLTREEAYTEVIKCFQATRRPLSEREGTLYSEDVW